MNNSGLPNIFACVYAKMMLQWDCIRATKIFVVSKYTQNDIIQNLRVDKKKIRITYNTIEDSFINKSKKEIQYLYQKYGIPLNSKIILYVGNIKPHKNVEVIVRAFSKISEENVRLVMVGRTFENNVREQLGIDERIGNKIILTGEVKQEEVVDWYNLADVFVFPSLYEGFGIPPLEAMACGTPVICSDAASLPEVVGGAAIFFNPQDEVELSGKIYDVINEVEKTKIYIRLGKARVDYFRSQENNFNETNFI